jgi:hypothetical protein
MQRSLFKKTGREVRERKSDAGRRGAQQAETTEVRGVVVDDDGNESRGEHMSKIGSRMMPSADRGSLVLRLLSLLSRFVGFQLFNVFITSLILNSSSRYRTLVIGIDGR